MTLRAAAVAVLVLAALPAAAVADSTPPVITLAVHGPQGDAGWFTGNVVVNWTVSDPESLFVTDDGCVPSTTFTSETSGTTSVCRATSAGGSAAQSAVLRIDTTPPSVTAATPSPAAAATGWFRQGFDVAWTGSDATSGIAECTAASYRGPDTANGSLAGTCRDRAGNVSAALPFAFRFDATPPSVTGAVPARPPDAGRWYTAPVEIGWNGADATSGIDSCTRVTYAGPDDARAAPAGTCVDRAGNVSAPVAAALPYDATPPALLSLEATPTGPTVRLAWRATGATRVVLTRTPGRRGRRQSVVFDGTKPRYTDEGVSAGRRYTYALRALDAAGNASTTSISVVAGSGRTGALVAPISGARLRRPPLLRWHAVRGAAYYNVQLFRGGRQVLSAWPDGASLQLARSWRYGGRRQQLARGQYQWYVWAGYGPRSERRYGRLLGRRSFRIG
jgi:hypothetical protein